MVEKT